MSCELVCTGWYSSDTPRSYITSGDDEIRSAAFRPLWWQSLDTFAKPENVLVVDSASPVKPNDDLYTKTKLYNVELLKNPGHSQTSTSHYCGYMASVIIGLEFSLLNDVDFFLYVEQDALIYGKNFIEKIKSQLLKSDYVFGGGKREIQQSVFAINKRGIRKFLAALHAMNSSDKQVSPEIKFMYAASLLKSFPLTRLLSYDNGHFLWRLSERILINLMPVMSQYTKLPFGYGRVRPINFNDEVFYFQHASRDELETYKQLTGFGE